VASGRVAAWGAIRTDVQRTVVWTLCGSGFETKAGARSFDLGFAFGAVG
jgi:hypothetical protein